MILRKYVGLLGAAIVLAAAIQAQPPQHWSPADLNGLVSRVALYPDPLLAQVLAAATFPDQIPEAARWADEHHYLNGEALSRAIMDDQLPWDPSVQALLPFPSVLDTMSRDMAWTSDLGNAFLGQEQEVMDAVQRMRQQARDYGYLRSNGQVVVSGGPLIEIVPVNPAFICVPYYDPLIVFARPRPGFRVGLGINFGFGVSIGTWFRPWGWGGNRFDWNQRVLIVNNTRWERSYVNRGSYVHPYAEVRRAAPPVRAQEQHAAHPRSERERQAPQRGRPAREEHRR